MSREARKQPSPNFSELEPAEGKLSDAIKDANLDCMPCRIIGSSAFVGLGIYSYVSGRHQLRQQEAAILKSKSFFGLRSRQAGINGIAITLVGMGLYRLIN